MTIEGVPKGWELVGIRKPKCGESDGSWAIYINDELRGKYRSSMAMAEHLALLIEEMDRIERQKKVEVGE